ncbi:MAG TPA: four helix bundle protein [Syntrophobacteraceae bacterium]|nr:four helix bundle protein [Syntrophobacteraceae bacterium]
MAYGSFEDLEVWKRACRLAVKVYEVLRECRDYGLKDQMTRAAVSIASNTAEGAERDSKAEFIRFLHIAKGSAAELRTQVYIAHRIGFLESSHKEELIAELKTLSSMLHALIKSLKHPNPPPRAPKT